MVHLYNKFCSMIINKKLFYIPIICAFICIASCTTQHYIRKTDKVVTKLFAKDSVKATKTVSKYVPIQTVTKVSTRYVKGKNDTINTVTTYTVDCDSAIVATLDEVARKHVKCPDCPPSIVRVDTFIKDSLHIIIDPTTAIELSKASKERDEYKAKFESRTKYVWITWIGGISLLLIIILLVYLHEQGKVWDFASKMGRNG